MKWRVRGPASLQAEICARYLIGRCFVILKMDGRGALHEQLGRALKSRILNGEYQPGSRLPATRTLAAALGLSRSTVLGAYEILCVDQSAGPCFFRYARYQLCTETSIP